MSKKETILPLGDQVLILPIQTERPVKKSNGIILPDNINDEDKNKYGLVVAVGPGRYDGGFNIPVGVKKGDKVCYWDNPTVATNKFKVDGEEVILLKESQLLVTIN